MFKNKVKTMDEFRYSGRVNSYPSKIPESPSQRISLVEQKLLTLSEYLSLHDSGILEG
jgi:hypothetical protein